MKRHLAIFKKSGPKCHCFASLFTAFLLLISLQISAQDVTVSGTVVGDSANPLSGVSVTVKGTSRGTSTRSTGQFSISAPSKSTLVFSSVGYLIKEVQVAGQSTLTISLAASSQELSQVVVVGYLVIRVTNLA